MRGYDVYLGVLLSLLFSISAFYKCVHIFLKLIKKARSGNSKHHHHFTFTMILKGYIPRVFRAFLVFCVYHPKLLSSASVFCVVHVILSLMLLFLLRCVVFSFILTTGH